MKFEKRLEILFKLNRKVSFTFNRVLFFRKMLYFPPSFEASLPIFCSLLVPLSVKNVIIGSDYRAM